MDSGTMIAQQIERLIAERDTNPRAVSLAAGMSPTGVRDIIRRKTKNPTYDSLLRIADVLKVNVAEIVGSGLQARPSIAVAGRVGAGAMVELVDAYEKGDGLFRVTAPDGISPHGIVAVEVEGDSMAPIYLPGDVLLYSREVLGVPSEALNRICVCEDEVGQAWVKQVRTGTQPGKFHLISTNPTGQNRLDVPLKWAAPVRMHLPAEFVKRVEMERGSR